MWTSWGKNFLWLRYTQLHVHTYSIICNSKFKACYYYKICSSVMSLSWKHGNGCLEANGDIHMNEVWSVMHLFARFQLSQPAYWQHLVAYGTKFWR